MPVLLSALDLVLTVAIVGGLIAGFVIVLNRRPVLGPTVSRYAAIGLGVLALTQIAGQIWSRVGVQLMWDLGYARISALFSIYNLVSHIAFAVGIGFLVAAVLARRSHPESVLDPYLGSRPVDR